MKDREKQSVVTGEIFKLWDGVDKEWQKRLLKSD